MGAAREAGKRRKVAIAGGGTAGHVLAGLAFLKAYRERGADAFFLGSAHGVETELVPREGIELYVLSSSPYERQAWQGKLAALFNLARAIWQARRVLRREQPDIMIGVGGFASIGPVLAARSFRIPVVIHEANATPGIANRWVARFATRVCEGMGGTGLPRALHTGNPVAIECAPRTPRQDGEAVRFLVAGGSEGSPFLNRQAPALLAAVRALGVPAKVRHLAGAGDLAPVRAEYTRLGIPATVSGFVPQTDRIYAETDIAVTCAGALTLTELAASGIPSLLIPLSGAAAAHQVANARAFADRTGCRWIEEKNLTVEHEAKWLSALALDAEKWGALSLRMQSFGSKGAAQSVVNLCEELLGC